MRIAGLLMIVIFSVALSDAYAADRAFAFEGKGASGETIRFDPAHRDRPAILLFWATWCPYCKALMPHIQSVYDAAGKSKLDVYAIDIKDDGDPVAELKERHQTFTLVRDGDDIATQYGVRGTPGLFLVDAKGEVVYHPVGGDSAKVEDELRTHLGLAPAAPAKKHAAASGS